MESDPSSFAEDPARQGDNSNGDRSVSEERSVVPVAQQHGNTSSGDPQSTTSHTCNIINYPLALDKSSLEAFHVECFRRKFLLLKYDDNTVAQLLATSRAFNARAYRGHQLNFMKWCTTHQLDPNHFTMANLINFLSSQRSRYSVTTLSLIRTAIAHFHVQPSQSQQASQLDQVFNLWRQEAPPVPTERPPVDLSPSFDFCDTVVSVVF